MIDPTPNDIRIYEEELLPWLPKEIIDCHVHLGTSDLCGPISPERMSGMWALEIATELTWKDLREICVKLFPKRNLSILAFGFPYREIDSELNNRYLLDGAADPRNAASALMITRPEWDAERIAEGLSSGFAGIKPYPDLAPNGVECSIYDFLPREHLQVLNDAGGILMLHLPRAGRMADAKNIRESLEIAENYSAIKLIVAHIGRSFCLPTAKVGLPPLADHPGIFFDTAANLNSDVFRYALETVGPERIIFGSDLPITLMKGIREHAGERYINYTSGNYTWNGNRKPPEVEENYTYYIYEELLAIIRAVRQAGMGAPEMEKIMFSNCRRLLDRS
jgi:hypothetical protein